MASAVIKFSAILMFVAVCAASYSENRTPYDASPVTEVCLGCLCQAASGCIQKTGCEEGNACGLFRITEPYWIDAGKPTALGEPENSTLAFKNCVIDPYCAARTVQGYMRRFAQDCNGDGQINCYDYMAIHKLGGYGCTNDLPYQYATVFNQCVAAIAAQQQYNG